LVRDSLLDMSQDFDVAPADAEQVRDFRTQG